MVSCSSGPAAWRWNGAEVELLISPPEGSEHSNLRFQFSGLWGLSSSEVFVAVNDRAYDDYRCGAPFLLWFDGQRFHPF